jgi:hypothetical protein
MSDILPAVLD